MTRISLDIPFARKDEFKVKYGRKLRWYPADKVWCWVSDDPVPEDLKGFALVVLPEYKPTDPLLTIDLCRADVGLRMYGVMLANGNGT